MRFRHAAAGFVAVIALAVGTAVGAQAPYPYQTIKIIVPNPPGGLPDTITRIVGKDQSDGGEQRQAFVDRA